MNVLIGCEYTGIVSNEFHIRGHSVVSCDLLPLEPHHLSPVLSGDLSPGLSPGQSGALSLVLSSGKSAALSVDRSTGWSHYQGDIFDILPGEFDLAIFFPPCTYLARAQSHLLSDPARLIHHWQAIEFVKRLWSQPIKKIALENPIGFLSTKFMQPTQIVSPNFFGDPYAKDICLWLKNLPTLRSTCIVPATKKVSNHVNSRMTREQRSKIKSKFFPGIAKAMAEQWG